MALFALLGACHPGPAAAVTALGLAHAAASGRRPRECALVGAAVLAGQLSVGWCNDAVDARRDVAAGRRDKPVVRGAVSAGTVRAAAATALAACVPLSLAAGRGGALHLTGVAAAWAYDLGVKSTPFSWVPYAVGFGGLPVFTGRAGPRTATAAALLGVGAHLADVLPDLDGDRATGVRGLPHRWGARRTRAAIPLPLIAAAALLRPERAMAVTAVTTAAALAGGRVPKAPFAAAVLTAALLITPRR
ncbi:UbiA family prenyltransferase [Actinomadura parmotrematis]|uniref:UbiA family prenyltransferase n=1 Tax=Actinomadura parmotrematis TaxID=2864039 RepID=A0ABS7G0T9_9ACTN|nr:UbiA family prenyltransferase [Actinomadura parmotrematis]MBW8485484.1 UbiA family prenyltransferase [Actinomadura parmotrematis]